MTDHLVSLPLPHACLRAKERYGLELSRDDMVAIARRCKAGEGRTKTNPDASQYHTIVWRDRVLWVVYAPPGPGVRLPDGVVITVMPPDIANVSLYQGHQHAERRRQGHYQMRRR